MLDEMDRGKKDVCLVVVFELRGMAWHGIALHCMAMITVNIYCYIFSLYISNVGNTQSNIIINFSN